MIEPLESHRDFHNQCNFQKQMKCNSSFLKLQRDMVIYEMLLLNLVLSNLLLYAKTIKVEHISLRDFALVCLVSSWNSLKWDSIHSWQEEAHCLPMMPHCISLSGDGPGMSAGWCFPVQQFYITVSGYLCEKWIPL